MSAHKQHTIVETGTFIKRARSCMTDGERHEAIDMIGTNPEVGDLIRGTGGIRKVRFAIGSKGKRGGARIIYYFHSDKIPVFLLTVFSKGKRVDLTQSERNMLAKLVKELVAQYGA